MQDYRKLRVWKSGFALAINVRRAADGFPKTGYAELKAQMTSAAESIVNNIVEGCGSDTSKEFARFLTIAIKSAMELESELQLARGYKILSHATWQGRAADTIELRKMLYALRSKVRNPDPPNDPSRSISHPTTRNPKPTQPTTVTPSQPVDQP
jgi:four helix bundle protein